MYGNRQSVMKTDTKSFRNVIHEPVFRCYGDTLIINIIPPPVFHLLIVHVTTIHKGIVSNINCDCIIMFPHLLINIKQFHLIRTINKDQLISEK